MSTLKDVARRAGVSVTTVSIIINGKAQERKISDETIKKVYQAIADLNYSPNITARALRGESSPIFTVGLYWASDFRSSFLTRFITGLQEWILQSNQPVNIVVNPYRSQELYKEKNLYNLHSFNAAIIANASQADLDYIHANPIPIPTVLNNRPSEKYSTVSVNNQELGELAAKHLAEKSVKTVGVLSLHSEFYSMTRASQGFIQKSSDLGMTMDPAHHLLIGPKIEDSVRATERVFSKLQVPQGIFCDTDAAALGLIYTLNRLGIEIPEATKIVAIGQGNPNFTRFSTPSITIVDVPLEQMAYQCLEILMRQHLMNDLRPVHHQFLLELTERESSQI